MELPLLFDIPDTQPVPQKALVEYVIVGIGNIGDQYTATRHNIGFRVCDELARRYPQVDKLDFVQSAGITIQLPDTIKVAIIWPTTYVNRSGDAVTEALAWAHVLADRCLLLVDDFNIELSTVRLRRSGSAGGHNGLKSIINAIGTEFPRVRVGIGPLPPDTSIIDFVLGKFSTQEEELVLKAVTRAADAAVDVCVSGIDRAINRLGTALL